MPNFTRAIKTLEFDKILALLAECAPTDGSRDMAAALRPTSDIDRVRKMQTQTSDAKALASIKGMPGFSGVHDITDSLTRAEKGAVLSPRELLDVAAILSCARRLIDYIESDKRGETSLDENFARLSGNRTLEEKIRRAIIAEDMIADEASPALADIRRKMRFTNNHIKDTLQKYVGASSYSKYLQDNIVTMRNGRYVVPVKAEDKNEIKGLIHDTSSSGATVFIEPLAVVEANNELRELEAKERHEIERILAEFSAEVADNSGTLSLDYYNITELAFIFAKSELSYRMDAASPAINGSEDAKFAGKNDDMKLELIRARHPLLDKKKVVPITIALGGEFDTLVITGPNTGGKTVTLKTLGLFALMVQSGLHVPCDAISHVCVFDEILADIGDEQSIEQSLSTFSAHMVNTVDILGCCGERSLVLFDELGAGTDPVEGAALAEAILERVRQHHSLCAATTHYAELKAYALDTDGVANASCEFDIETLRPTYKLVIGTPGKSNAFAISQKLGLDGAVINRANALISGEGKRFEYVIEKLEQNRMEMERERDEAAKLRREYEEFKVNAENDLRRRVADADKEIERERAKAQQLLSGAKVTSDYVLAQLEEVKRARESADLAATLENARRSIKSKLRESEDIVNPVRERSADDYVLPRALHKGDEVMLINIGKNGVLIEDPDRDGNVRVQAGIINTRTNIKNLMLASDAEKRVLGRAPAKKKPVISDYNVAVSRNFRQELDIRGMNGEDGSFMIDKYLDEAKIAGIKSVRIVHGKGTGALKNAVWQYLKGDPRVEDFRIGQYGEGDLGVTVVTVK
ncbi:MAG: endonuclease MutS2 [Eubacteriales bacterium]